ncbi:MAG TPA: tetratricopeptide repeat protein [Alloacidobacterium sp.]|nr:tetratricopeptide repeat protein [Alloacidobacterium sp.]
MKLRAQFSVLTCVLACAVCLLGQETSSSESELGAGVVLIHQGRLDEAVPHLLRARGYAASFNLALCYLGLDEYGKAASQLEMLRASGHDNAGVNNLLAQTYIGQALTTQAIAAFHRAEAQTPKDEKLYLFIVDACTDQKNFTLGLQIVNEGLKNLPDSARLHYEKAMFLAQTGNDLESQTEFSVAANLASGTDIAYLVLAQKSLFADDLPEAVRVAREGIRAGNNDPVLLDLLAEVLIHTGALPGQPEFIEAESLLERAVKEKPRYSTAQIALGRLYLMENRTADAVLHLETARRLEPQNRAVYANLAEAYRRLGEKEKARQMLKQLGNLIENHP